MELCRCDAAAIQSTRPGPTSCAPKGQPENNPGQKSEATAALGPPSKLGTLQVSYFQAARTEITTWREAFGVRPACRRFPHRSHACPQSESGSKLHALQTLARPRGIRADFSLVSPRPPCLNHGH